MDKLQKQVTVELEQLNHLLETHRPLLNKCTMEEPDRIEISALAAMLHAFYNGIENILKRIAIQIDKDSPRGDFWHRQLLDKMICSTSSRPAVISSSLRDILRDYLYFRHVIRHAYTFDLKWEKMAGLVEGCEKTMRLLEMELNAFFKSFKPTNAS